MTINSTNDLGRMLKQRRLMLPMTLQELSRSADVSASHLGRIERGERYPSARVLRRLSKPLGLTESELFSFAGYLSSESVSTVESKAAIGRLDPYVASVLSQEPVEIQRAVVGALSIIKMVAKSLCTHEKKDAKGGTGDDPGPKCRSRNDGTDTAA